MRIPNLFVEIFALTFLDTFIFHYLNVLFAMSRFAKVQIPIFWQMNELEIYSVFPKKTNLTNCVDILWLSLMRQIAVTSYRITMFINESISQELFCKIVIKAYYVLCLKFDYGYRGYYSPVDVCPNNKNCHV